MILADWNLSALEKVKDEREVIVMLKDKIQMQEREIEQLERRTRFLDSILEILRSRCAPGIEEDFDNGNYDLLCIVGNRGCRKEKINLDDNIKVKLTPHGMDIFYHRYDEMNQQCGGRVIAPQMPRIDEDGYTTFQLNDFISLYGEHIGMAKYNVIEPLDIIVCE